MKVRICDDDANTIGHYELTAVPRVGDVVSMEYGAAYKVIAVGWSLHKYSDSEPVVYLDIRKEKADV